MTNKTPPLIAGRDMLQLVTLGVLFVVAWGVPEEYWPFVCRRLASLTRIIARAQQKRAVQRMQAILGRHAFSTSLERAVSASLDHKYESYIQYLRLHRNAEWCPRIRAEGVENIEAARRRGSGVILWTSVLVYSNLVIKMGLRQSGYRASHLSRAEHGFGDSRFARRFLNPIAIKIEERYLSERVVIEERGSRTAMQTLKQKLDCNGVVSITASHAGKRIARAGFFQGRIRLATGAIHLGLQTGAPLLPVFALKTEDEGFRVIIGKPLEFSSDTDPYESAVQQYADLTGAHLVQHLEQWYSLLLGASREVVELR